jgi:hypothetical protein
MLLHSCAIEPHRFLKVLTGTLFTAPVYHTYGTIIADEKYDRRDSRCRSR